MNLQKILIILGLIFLVSGLLLPYIGKVPLGRLPGDIIIKRPGFTFYFPVTTLVIISVIVSLLLRIFRK